MQAKLIAADEWIPQREILLSKLPAVIGRHEQADIPLSDRWVSQRHCELYEVDGSLAVRDLGSRNGTLINGAYVERSVVMPGEKLTVGLSRFIVSYVPRSTVTEPAPG
jgi:pSer/pThr/pTyr-binding forkhead associated (FHA) protein